MTNYSKITVLYKYKSFMETPPYWSYKESFPSGWIWLSVEKKNSEDFEYFTGPAETKSQMWEYLQAKFLFLKSSGTLHYFKIFDE
jgi:hypothetical protein